MKKQRPESGVELPERLKRQTSLLLNHATSQANRIVSQHFDGPGGRMHYALLAGLEEFGTIGQAELCDRIGIDRGDAVAALTTLESNHFVRRRPDPRDGRRNIVEITDPGQARLRELDTMVDAAQNELAASLSAAEHRQLVALLTKLMELG